MSLVGGAPSEGALFISHDHFLTFATYKGKPAGVNVYHKDAEGRWCAGWCPFRNYPWANEFKDHPDFQAWDVVTLEPLTLSPSIKCRACGDHGHIVKAKWVPA